MLKISILTASIRPEGLDMVKKCLDKQDFSKEDFEWIIVGNESVCEFMGHSYSSHQVARVVQENPYRITVVKERIKNEGDFYNLTKAYNDLFKHATGELAVMWVDMTWASSDVLSSLWTHYQNNPKACVGGVGDQYDLNAIEFGKPQLVVWKDPRKRIDLGSFYEISPVDFEMCLASIPVQAVKDVGGFDERFDQYAAICEKELCLRMDKLGYKFYLDQSMEYRALKHGRIGGSEEWDKRYEKGCEYLRDCIHEILEERRLKLEYI